MVRVIDLPPIYFCLAKEYTSDFNKLLIVAFNWKDTSEGLDFWQNIYLKYEK